MGAVLLQKDDKTSYMQPIYFASKTMNPSERGYSDVEKMMFALIFAIRRFRSYLLSKSFVVLTVEHCFPFVVQHMHLSPRISKWVAELQEFEYSFKVEETTRASLADVLTYRHRERKIIIKEIPEDKEEPLPLSDAFTLFFDGAFRKKTGMAGAGILILNPQNEVITKEGRLLKDVHSNNEAEYATLKYGLEKCLHQGISRLVIKGDSLLIVKQINGVWACKSESLLKWLQQVKDLLKGIGETQIIHIPRELSKETDALANEQLEEIMLAGRDKISISKNARNGRFGGCKTFSSHRGVPPSLR